MSRPGYPAMTENDCVEFGAALYTVLPAWLATTLHVPAFSNVIVAPFGPPAVQTVGVVVVNVTTRPEDAVAVTVTVPCDRLAVGIAGKMIDWVAWITENVRATEAAL